MPKLPEFNTKPIKGIEDNDFSKWSLKRIAALEALQYARTPEANAKRTANTDWKAQRAKQVANTDYSKASRGLKAYVESTKKKVFVIKDGKHIATFDSIKKASENLPVSFSSIQKILDKNSVLTYANGYTFTTGEFLDWNTVYDLKSKKQRGIERSRKNNQRVNIYDIENNFITEVLSISEACDYTGVSFPALHSAITKGPRRMWRTGKDGFKYKFEYVKKTDSK